MYDPRIGRWLSEDPIGFEGGDANLSRYVGNSPTMFTDPDGLERRRISEEYRYLPTDGRWQGIPGDSRFIPSDPELPTIVYKKGQPDFRQFIYRQREVCGIVEIDLDSDLSKTPDIRSRADRDAATAAMRKKYPGWKRPRGYAWHHQFVNPRTGRGQMILVEKDVHKLATHEGAFSFFTKYLEAKLGGSRKALIKANKALRGLSLIGDLGRKAAGPLALICAANVARQGYANGGVLGASDALIRDMMFAEEVEDLLRPVGKSIDTIKDNHKHNFGIRRRYRGVLDDPAVREELYGKHKPD